MPDRPFDGALQKSTSVRCGWHVPPPSWREKGMKVYRKPSQGRSRCLSSRKKGSKGDPKPGPYPHVDGKPKPPSSWIFLRVLIDYRVDLGQAKQVRFCPKAVFPQQMHAVPIYNSDHPPPRVQPSDVSKGLTTPPPPRPARRRLRFGATLRSQISEICGRWRWNLSECVESASPMAVSQESCQKKTIQKGPPKVLANPYGGYQNEQIHEEDAGCTEKQHIPVHTKPFEAGSIDEIDLGIVLNMCHTRSTIRQPCHSGGLSSRSIRLQDALLLMGLPEFRHPARKKETCTGHHTLTGYCLTCPRDPETQRLALWNLDYWHLLTKPGKPKGQKVGVRQASIKVARATCAILPALCAHQERKGSNTTSWTKGERRKGWSAG